MNTVYHLWQKQCSYLDSFSFWFIKIENENEMCAEGNKKKVCRLCVHEFSDWLPGAEFN